MANFEEAVKIVLQNEGGFIDNPADPGGATNFGISQRAYPSRDIEHMTKMEAIAIYEADYWKFGEITSQRVATKVFDLAVNMGEYVAVRLLQVSVGVIEAGPLIADGKLGPQTIAATNAADEEKLMDELKAQACLYYAKIGKPEFLLGWLRRAVKG